MGGLVHSGETDVADATWFEAEIGSGWTATLRLVGDEDRLVLTEMCLHPSDPKSTPVGGITTDVLRFNLEPLFASLRGVLREHAGTDVLDEWGLRQTVERPVDAGRRGRRPQDGRQLAEIASAYLSLVEDGERSPIKALAGSRYLSESAVRRQLDAARRAGIYESAGQGRAGGQLTRKGRALLP
jgi:hypothetical protein